MDILCDNQAALYNLDKAHSKSALVQECHKTLNLLAEKRPVTLRWVPGHEGIDGNERADHQTKDDAAKILSLERQQLRHLFTALTRHGNLNYHLHRSGVVDDPLCPKCERAPETSLHHVVSCPAYCRQRLATLHSVFLDSNVCLLYTSPSPRDGATSRMPSSA